MKQIILSVILISALAAGIPAQAEDNCIMIPVQTAGLEPEVWLAEFDGELMPIELAAGGAFGLSCQSVQSVVGKVDTATAVVKDALIVALLNPKLGAWVAGLTARVASRPYVLAVLVVGTAGSVWVYRTLDTAKGDCEKAEEQERFQQIMVETLKGQWKPGTPIRCERGI